MEKSGGYKPISVRRGSRMSLVNSRKLHVVKYSSVASDVFLNNVDPDRCVYQSRSTD